MSTNKVILVSLIILYLLIPIFVYNSTQYVSAGNYSFKVNIVNKIEEFGGNLLTTIILKPSSTGNINILRIDIARDFISNDTFIRTYIDKTPYNATTNIHDDTFSIILKNIKFGSNSEIKIIIYQTRYVTQDENGTYHVNILSGILSNYNITYMKVDINLPPNTKSIKPPKGFTQYMTTPRGVTPEIYRLEKIYSTDELKTLTKPPYLTLNLTSTRGREASIKIGYGNVNMRFMIEPDGKINCEMILTIFNKGSLLWSGRDHVVIFKNPLIRDLRAYSELGRELDVSETSSEYKISMPYPILPTDKAVIKIDFSVPNSTRKKGLFGEKILYNIKISNLTEIPFNLMNISVIKYGGEIVNNKIIKNYTEYSKPIILSGETQLSPVDLVTYSGMGYIILILIFVGLISMGYEIYTKLGLREIPPEVRKYLDSFKEILAQMDKIIELEEMRINGKISDRKYIKEKSKYTKEINRIRKETIKGRKKIEDVAKENDYISGILDEIKEIEKKWNELIELEEKYRRRISVEEYTQRRKDIIKEFKSHISRLERKL